MTTPTKTHKATKRRNQHAGRLSVGVVVAKPRIAPQPYAERFNMIERASLRLFANIYALVRPIKLVFRRLSKTRAGVIIGAKVIQPASPVTGAILNFVNITMDKVTDFVVRTLGRNRHTQKISYRYGEQNVKHFSRRTIQTITVIFVFTLIAPLVSLERTAAGAGQIEYYSASEAAQHDCYGTTTCSSGAGYYDIPGAATYVAGSNFTVGEDYLIMVWAGHNGNSATGYSGARVVHGSTSFTDSEAIEEVDRTGVDHKTPYFWFTEWTAANEDIEVQTYFDGTNTSWIEDISLVIINVEDLKTDGNFYSDEDSGNATLSTTWSVRSTLTFTPDSATDDWWIMGYTKANTSSVNAGQAFQMQLDVAGTTVQTSRVDGEDNANTPVRPIGWSDQLAASSQTIELEARSLTSTQQIDASGVFALNLNAFEDHAVVTDTGDSPNVMDTDDQWEDHVSFSLDPTSSGDFLFAAGSVMDDNNARVHSRIRNTTDSASLTDEVGGWEHNAADEWPYSIGSFETSVPTGSNTYVYQGEISNAGTAESQDSWMVAFSMELAGAATPSSSGSPMLTQEGYVFENDDSNSSIIFSSFAEAEEGDSTSITVDKPAGVVEGDLMLTVWSADYFSPEPTHTTLTGWTLIDDVWGSTGGNKLAAYYKVATASEPADYTWTKSAGTNHHITTIRVLGADTANLVDADSFSADETWDMNLVAPTVTPTIANGVLFSAVSSPSGGDIDVPSGMSLISNHDGSAVPANHSIAYEQLSSSAATGTNTFTSSSSVRSSGFQIVLKPADKVAGSVQAGSKFSTGKTLTGVRQGESISLRTQLTNTGAAVASTDELALFYDRNDGMWSKVQSSAAPYTTAGSGCGAGASTDFSCEEVFNGDATTEGRYTDIAVGSDGRIWVAFWELNGGDGTVIVAQYVGDGLGNCDSFVGVGSDAWNCERVFDGDNGYDAVRLSLTTAPDGTPWVSFRDNSTYSRITVAEYVGGGGGDCDTVGQTGGSDNWDCTEVWRSDAGGDTNYNDIVVDSTGKPWVSWRDGDSNDGKLWVASYEGTSGQNCDALSETTGGSDYWDCTLVFDGNDAADGIRSKIAMGPDDTPWIVFIDTEGTYSDIMVAEHVGTGGDCNTVGDSGGSSAWDCTRVYEADHVNEGIDNPDISIASDGNPWITFRNAGTVEELIVAKYVGTAGQDCDSLGGALGSDLWDCEVVFDDAQTVGYSTSIAEGPGGAMWVSFSNQNTNDGKVYLAYYLGDASGNCDTLGSSGGSDDWQCIEAYDGTLTSAGTNNSLAFDALGRPWVSFYVPATNDGQVWVSHFERQGEITIAPSSSLSPGDALEESHVDMTSSTDTTNRDDVDCIASGAAWNDGAYMGTENGRGLVIADGETTPQCTELSWTLDTSQATPGETYRFVVATKDAYSSDKGSWRGPIAVATDAYPTITISSSQESVYRYSKDTVYTPSTNCTDTDWACETLDSGVASGVAWQSVSSIAVNPASGNMWISYFDSTAEDLIVAKYVGSGGTGCTSTAWDCTIVDSTGDVGEFTSLAFDYSGAAWVSYRVSDTGDLRVAKYVGSNGTGCASSAWSCEDILTSGDVGYFSEIDVGINGVPWVYAEDETNGAAVIAHYVGGGSGSGCADSDWTCETIDSTADAGAYGSLAISPDGIPWVAWAEQTGDDLVAAHWVGSGGSCSNDAWECYDVDVTNLVVNAGTDIGFNSSGQAIIAYHYWSGNTARLATFVGSGGDCDSLRGGSDAWDCEDIESTANTEAGSIAMDSDGNPWMAFSTTDSGGVHYGRYVGSGGTGCDISSWDNCAVVESSWDGYNVDIAFDLSGTPWIVSYDDIADEINVAKMKLPPNQLGSDNPIAAGGRNAGNGDLRYHLSSGLSPYTDPYGTCGGLATMLGYCGLYTTDGQLDSITAPVNERPMYSFSTRYDSNSEVPTASVYFRSDTSPATNNVVLQAYRYGTTNAWETVSTYSTAGCSTENCIINAHPSGTTSEYFETDGSEYWVHYRLYQVESSSASITFSLDQFTAHKPVSKLRGGRVFRENVSDPLRWQ